MPENFRLSRLYRRLSIDVDELHSRYVIVR